MLQCLSYDVKKSLTTPLCVPNHDHTFGNRTAVVDTTGASSVRINGIKSDSVRAAIFSSVRAFCELLYCERIVAPDPALAVLCSHVLLQSALFADVEHMVPLAFARDLGGLLGFLACAGQLAPRAGQVIIRFTMGLILHVTADGLPANSRSESRKGAKPLLLQKG